MGTVSHQQFGFELHSMALLEPLLEDAMQAQPP